MGGDILTRKVRDLVAEGILARPLDGNHGSIHPKGGDFVSEGIPFIMATDLSHGRITLESCKYITADQARSLRKGFAKEGDVLLSHKATIGRTALVEGMPHEYIMLTPQLTYYRVVDKSRLNNRYLKYYFDSPEFQELLAAWSGAGSTRAYLGITGQLDLPIKVCEINDQRAIAHILGSLDDKIELNRQINQTLEQMAHATFKSWFIDFDPVVYNAVHVGNPVPERFQDTAERYRQNRDIQPLPQHILDLFPDRFVDSELGEIPAGWSVKPLDKIAHFLNGLACQKYPPKPDSHNLPVIKIRELRQGISANTDKANTGVPEKYLVENGDVLFSWSGSLLIDTWTQGRGVLNQHVFKLSSDEYEKWFYFYWTAHHLEEFQRIAADKATTMGHIKRHHLSDANVCVSPPEVMELADTHIGPLFEWTIKNDLEAASLKKARDTLLPKLISGELRIPEAKNLAKDLS